MLKVKPTNMAKPQYVLTKIREQFGVFKGWFPRIFGSRNLLMKYANFIVGKRVKGNRTRVMSPNTGLWLFRNIGDFLRWQWVNLAEPLIYNPDKSCRRIYQPRSQNVCLIKRVFGYKINSRCTRSCVVLKRILRVLKMDSLGAVAYTQEVQR